MSSRESSHYGCHLPQATDGQKDAALKKAAKAFKGTDTSPTMRALVERALAYPELKGTSINRQKLIRYAEALDDPRRQELGLPKHLPNGPRAQWARARTLATAVE